MITINYKMKMSLVILICCLFACGKSGTDAAPSKGYLTGAVKDGKGNPIAGAVVQADNTVFYNSNIMGTTKADGTYAIRLSQAGAYMAYAWFNKQYNNKSYKFYLHPDNTSGFTDEGATVNFSWQMKGKKAEPLTGYYGGTILIDKQPGLEIYDSENIEFTLIPSGPLIDGSAGEVIKMKHGLPGSDDYGKLVDIPVGRYKVSAKYLPENRMLKLRNQYDPASIAMGELELDFEPSSRDGDNMASIEYSGG